MSATAKGLIAALQRHHEPPKHKPVGGYLVTEIQAPESTRRADALWLPVNSAQRGRIVGYETKVSRADVVQELRDPMKADAWLQHCHEWYLVIPHTSIITGLDIPEEWGILTPPTSERRRSMIVVRKAPALNPTGDPRAAFSTVLAKLVYGGESMQAKMTAAENLSAWRHERMQEMNRELERLRLASGESTSDKLRVSEVLEAISARADELGISWRVRWELDAAKLADYVVGFMATEDPKDYTLAALDDAIKEATKRTDALRTAREALS
ncbi:MULTISPECIES: hypothetical protein [unclassified Microbacterium]|uniref:hypothetical protein n=1 Tax=unclassified Microbacterium TaxID=2609290 RepID=UPI003430264C